MSIQTLTAALSQATPTTAVAGADAEVVSRGAVAKNTATAATAVAIDTHVKTYLIQLLQALVTPGCFNTAVGPAVTGPSLVAFLTQLGVQAPPVAPAPTLPDDQVARIKNQVIQEIQRDYVLTPR